MNSRLLLGAGAGVRELDETWFAAYEAEIGWGIGDFVDLRLRVPFTARPDENPKTRLTPAQIVLASKHASVIDQQPDSLRGYSTFTEGFRTDTTAERWALSPQLDVTVMPFRTSGWSFVNRLGVGVGIGATIVHDVKSTRYDLSGPSPRSIAADHVSAEGCRPGQVRCTDTTTLDTLSNDPVQAFYSNPEPHPVVDVAIDFQFLARASLFRGVWDIFADKPYHEAIPDLTGLYGLLLASTDERGLFQDNKGVHEGHVLLTWDIDFGASEEPAQAQDEEPSVEEPESSAPDTQPAEPVAEPVAAEPVPLPEETAPTLNIPMAPSDDTSSLVDEPADEAPAEPESEGTPDLLDPDQPGEVPPEGSAPEESLPDDEEPSTDTPPPVPEE